MFRKQSGTSERDASATRQLFLKANLLYGLFYAVGFSIMTWGYDGMLLKSYRDALPWDKFVIGLSLFIPIGLLVGWVGGISTTSVVPFLVWGVVGFGVGFLVGHIPFEGLNWMTWQKEPRLWGEIIYTFERGAKVRTILITVMTTILGFAIGGIKNSAVHLAWDQGTSNRRLGWKSFLVLWISLPLALVQAGIADKFMNQPLREPQRAIAGLINIVLDEEIALTDSQKAGLRSLQPYQESITSDYQSHFVGFSKSTESWYSGYLDLWLNPELVLRCTTVGNRVVYCDDYSQRLYGWVGELAHAGLTGEQRWQQNPMKPLRVTEPVISWLNSNRTQLSEDYDIHIVQMIRGWYFINIRFTTGFEMECRFHSVEPVIVDECVIVSSSIPAN